MFKYDKFEVYMINRMNDIAKSIDSEDNQIQVEKFSELVGLFYEYEKNKDNGDIITD